MIGMAGLMSGAVGGGVVGGSVVRLLLDASQFDANLKSAHGRLLTTSRAMSKTGSVLTKGVTLPLIGIAAASVKMAIDFEGSMAKVRANSNLTGKEIDSLEKHILNLAGRTAKSPEELADGLYFLASAGLKASQVTEVLDASAKASAAGMGTVADVARLTANALNAYAKDGLKAKKVTDVLAAAVREGTAEPDEFANAIGRILPIAQKAGVSFGEVTASLASLSTIGLDVNEGVTAMRSLLSALEAPGTQAAKTLKDVGIGTQELRDIISEQGILGALRLLEDRTNGNIDVMRKIIPNIRGLTGAFGLTGQKADQVNGAFRRVIRADGDLDRAFNRTKKNDPAFVWRQMVAQLQAVGIELGQELLPFIKRDVVPVFKDVVHVLEDLMDGFRKLPEPIQKNILKWGLLAIALGPVLRLMGGILRISTRLPGRVPLPTGGVPGTGIPGGAGGAGAAGGLGLAATRAIPIFGWGMTAAIGAGALGTKVENDALDSLDQIKVRGVNATAAIDDLNSGWQSFRRAIGSGNDSMDVGVEGALKRHREFVAQITGGSLPAVADFELAVKDASSMTVKQAERLGGSIKVLHELGGSLSETELKQIAAALAQDKFNKAMDIMSGALGRLVPKHANFQSNMQKNEEAAENAAAKARIFGAEVGKIPNSKRVILAANTANARQAISNFKIWMDRQLGGSGASVSLSARLYRIEPRAFGGPVLAGHPYIVGETRPELFVPNTNGRIESRVGMRSDDQIVAAIRSLERAIRENPNVTQINGRDVKRSVGRLTALVG